MSEQAEPPEVSPVLDDATTPFQSAKSPALDDSIDNFRLMDPEDPSSELRNSPDMMFDPMPEGIEAPPVGELAMAAHKSPDDGPNIPECTAKSIEIVDLTETDDEDGQDCPGITIVHVAPRIKAEDAVPDQIPEAQVGPSETAPTADFTLPSLGETIVPDSEEDIIIRNVEDALLEDDPADVTNNFARLLQNATYLNTNRADSTLREVLEPEPQDSEEEDRKASRHYKNHKARYERRKANGDTSLGEDVAFEKAKIAEQARQTFRSMRKEYMRQEKDKESYLFFPEEDGPESEPDNEPVVAAGYMEVKDSPVIHLSSDSETGKKKSKGSKRKPREKKIGGGVTKLSAKSGAGSRRGRQKKTADFARINLLDLTSNNPIEEGRANEGLAAQPTLGGSKNKKDALVALIASLPESERDLHIGDRRKLEKASRTFTGHGAMKAAGEAGWLLKGMKSHLHHYQMLGASWMREREAAGSPRGGILGDTMGFGKTVMCLANIVDGKSVESTRKPRATLIVAPSNLVSQWSSEIDKHVKPEIFKDRIVHRAGSRVICANPSRTLGGQDIVITSYNEVMKSYPRNEPPSHLHTSEAKAEWWKTYYLENRGSLHLVHWHRIILDEAQVIKNHNSITSQAVRHLEGKFRWCLTATPIQNSLDEFWAIMNFLKEPSAGRSSYELFKQNFTRKGSQKALERLQVILGKVMLRRTHANKLFDRPVLQLPPIAPVKTIEVKFNNVERQIYKIVRSRFVQKMKMIGTGGGQTQHYQQMLVLLLRLRQLVGHPLLIQKTLRDLMETEDMERLWDLTSNHDELASDADPEYDVHADGDLQTVRVLQAALEYAGDRRSSGGSSNHVKDNKFSEQFRKCLQELHDNGQWAQINARSLCQACGNPPDNPHITSCHHLYCFQCLNDLWYSEVMQYGPKNSNKGTCLDCGTRFDKVDAYQAKGFGEASRRGTPSSKKISDNAEEDIDWFNTTGPILRSAKIKGAIDQIITWLGQDSTNKIIVFVQFRGLIKILSRVLTEEGIGCTQFDGSMSFDARDEAVKRFSEDSKVPVLLAALKAGGIGLNLTAANRVIILDLWWNFLTENQAFCRAYRIGQKRDVEVVRFVVKDSIDTDMQAMQERKTKEIDSAMEKKNHRALTMAELIELFEDLETSRENQKDGKVYGQGEDQPFVFPDDPYDKSDADSDVEMTG